VKVVSSAEIGGANGAFAAATDTIYVSRELLAGGNLGAITDVLREEIGHSVDARLNVTDSPGDEGAIFGAVVQGKVLSEGELQGLKSKDDTASILLGGEDTTIEMNQQGWALGSWRNTDFSGEVDQITYQNGNRSDGKDGIKINWGKVSPFDSQNFSFIPELDNFATSGATQAYFEAGKSYNFRVSADDEIVIVTRAVDGKSGNNWITPLNQDRTKVEWQTFPNSIFKEYSWTPTQSGSYVVQFWHREYTGDAGVDISWEKDSIRVENSSFDVNLSVYDNDATNQRKTADSSNIDPNKDTVVVIHGRSNGSKDENVFSLAKAAADSQYYQNSQVLYLDWKDAANDDGELLTKRPTNADGRIRPVAQWATNRLKELGIDPKRTILLGHSLGSYVASEIGRISGGVRNLVALDPAFPAGTYEIDDNNPGDDRVVEFSEVATRSIALVVSENAGLAAIAGDNDQAITADDSFLVNFTGYVGQDAPTDYHNSVVGVFKDLLSRQLSFPSLFTRNRFDKSGELLPSQFGFNNAFEGVISADLSNKETRITGLDYVSNGSNQRTWTKSERSSFVF